MKIYLAGGMKTGWQDRIIAQAPPAVEFFDPRAHGLERPEDYVRWDLEHVAAADVVIAQMSSDNPSGFGMSVEVGYAHALGKKIIFLDEMRDDWRSRYFTFHRALAALVITAPEDIPWTTLQEEYHDL